MKMKKKNSIDDDIIDDVPKKKQDNIEIKQGVQTKEVKKRKKKR